MLVLKDVKYIETPSNSPYIKNYLKVKAFILDNLFKVESVDDYIYLNLNLFVNSNRSKKEIFEGIFGRAYRDDGDGKRSYLSTDTTIDQLCKYKLLRQESNDIFIAGNFALLKFPSFNILELITQREADILEEVPCIDLNSNGIINKDIFELCIKEPHISNKPKYLSRKEHWRVSILGNDLKTDELIEKIYRVFLENDHAS